MKLRILFLPLLMVLMIGCSHALTIKNYDMYETPTKFSKAGGIKPSVAILPFSGRPDDLYYFNSIVTRLTMASSIGELYTDYIPRTDSSDADKPDLILSIRPSANYRSSGWNFLINWPGFIIFTPAWNGYVYHADILTQMDIQDKNGNLINQLEVPISYDIRQAEMDRTIFTGLTWLEVSLLAFGGGIYNATTFDRDIIGALQLQIKDNYSNYVVNELISRISSSSRSI